jgi:GNAT superfamily N-acetyltransferase
MVEHPHPFGCFREFAADAPRVFGPSPDSHRILRDHAFRQVGSYSLWWRTTPQYRNQSVGMIGHFNARNREVAQQILQTACHELAQAGCSFAVGPIDGSTWNSYRLVTDPGSEPPFFLEPQNSPDVPNYFLEQGFVLELAYFSAIDSDLARPDPIGDQVADHMAKLGVSIRSLRIEDFEEELRRFHTLASICFRSHDLYQDIDESDFCALYRPLRNWIEPDFVVLAERESIPIGFAFGIPDILERERTGKSKTLVLKTLGILPDSALAGLGYHLLHSVRKRAAAAGVERMILALMRDAGYLKKRVRNLGTPFRRYSLFVKELAR